jgi:hypothetical protein
MINRRSFFQNVVGGIAGLLGYTQVSKAIEPTNPDCVPGTELPVPNNWYHRPHNDMFEVLENGEPVRKDRPGWGLVKLLENPNPEQTFYDLVDDTKDQMWNTGIALIWMPHNSVGIPNELHVLPTNWCIPHPASADYPDGCYKIKPDFPFAFPDLTGIAVSAENMIRVTYLYPKIHYCGFRPRETMQQLTLIESIPMKEKTSMVLPQDEIDKIRKEMESTFQGAENQGRFYIATPGVGVEPWSGTPKDMNYRYNIDPLHTKIASVLTRHLAPKFGENLQVVIK